MRHEILIYDDLVREGRLDKGKLLTAGRAREECPWASVVVPVEGGYGAWESEDEYKTWKRQI